MIDGDGLMNTTRQRTPRGHEGRKEGLVSHINIRVNQCGVHSEIVDTRPIQGIAVCVVISGSMQGGQCEPLGNLRRSHATTSVPKLSSQRFLSHTPNHHLVRVRGVEHRVGLVAESAIGQLGVEEVSGMLRE